MWNEIRKSSTVFMYSYTERTSPSRVQQISSLAHRVHYPPRPEAEAGPLQPKALKEIMIESIALDSSTIRRRRLRLWTRENAQLVHEESSEPGPGLAASQ